MKITPHISRAENMYEFLRRYSHYKSMFEHAFFNKMGYKVNINLGNRKSSLSLITTFINSSDEN